MMEENTPRWVVTETWLSRKPAADAFLVSALATMFLAIGSLVYWNDIAGASGLMKASQSQVFERNQLWRLFTALLAHGDEKHLLSNSFLFFVLGGFINGYFGSKLFPALAFLFGALTNLIILKTMSPETSLLGASGIVFWLGGVWLTLYYLIDIKRSHRQRILRTLGVAIVLFFPAEAFDPSTSYRSHFLGFFFGVLAALVHYFFHRQKYLNAVRRVAVFDD